jgi:hypothetical protein
MISEETRDSKNVVHQVRISGVIKSRRMIWAGHVARVGGEMLQNIGQKA